MTRDRQRAATEKGAMPPTDQIPEPPRHPLYITTQGEPTLRFVTSAHDNIWTAAHRQHLLVECDICGHVSADWGFMRDNAWMSHEMHHNSRHVGTKVVWRLADVADTPLADLVEQSRYRNLRNRDDGVEHLTAYRGDTPDDRVRELAHDRLASEDEAEADAESATDSGNNDEGQDANSDSDPPPLVMVHLPPTEAYPESPEADAPEAIYVA